MTVKTSDGSVLGVEVSIWEAGSGNDKRATNAQATSQDAVTGTPFQFKLDSPKLWSPDSPNLYNISVKMGNETVQSYLGFRTVSRGEVDGVQRPLLNGEFIFQFGTLDQGFWPDGIYTAPSREAMVYDLQQLQKIGYNMVRKHVSPAVTRSCTYYSLELDQG
jgi:beta-galactosidase/beta-glucuronidase